MSFRYRVAGVFGANLLGKLCNAVTLVLIIRLYGTDTPGYAAYTNAHTMFSLTIGLFFMAFNQALVREASHAYHTEGQPLYSAYRRYFTVQAVGFGLLLAVVLLAPAGVGRLLFGSGDYQTAVLYGLLAAVGANLSNWVLHQLQSEDRFGLYNHLNFWRQALLVPGALLLVWQDVRGLGPVMAVFGLANLLPSLVVLAQLRRLHLLSGQGWDVPSLWATVKPLRGLLLVYALYTVYDQIGIFLLGHLSTPTEVAGFGVLFRYYGAAMQLVVVLNAVFLPRFAGALSGDRAARRALFHRWLRFTAPGLLLVAPVLYIAQPAWVWLNTEQYAHLYPSACVLGVGVYLNLLTQPAFNAALAEGRYRQMALYLAATLLTFGVAAYLTLPTHGAPAAAWLTVLCCNVGMQLALVYEAFYRPERRAPTHA
ncbi:MAG: hypothetical protein SFY70_08090 [Bacteroidia bacterium]|nr:hypothetical protein [Bacteroidia bacterium]